MACECIKLVCLQWKALSTQSKSKQEQRKILTMAVMDKETASPLDASDAEEFPKLQPQTTAATEAEDSDVTEETDESDGRNGDDDHRVRDNSVDTIDMERAESIARCRREIVDMFDSEAFGQGNEAPFLGRAAANVEIAESSEVESMEDPRACGQHFNSGYDKAYSMHVLNFLKMHGMEDAVKELSAKMNGRTNELRDTLRRPRASVEEKVRRSSTDIERSSRQLETRSFRPGTSHEGPSINKSAPTTLSAASLPVHLPDIRRVVSDVPRSPSDMSLSLSRAKSASLVPGLSTSTPGAVAVVGLGADLDGLHDDGDASVCVALGGDCEDANPLGSSKTTEGSSDDLCPGSEIPPTFNPAESGESAVTATAVEDIISVEATRVRIYDADTEENETTKQRHNPRAVAFLFCLMTIVIVAVSVALTITFDGRKKGFATPSVSPAQPPYTIADEPELQPTWPPTLAPTLSAESRLEVILETAALLSGSDISNVTNSSQFQAIHWMAEEDPFTNLILNEPDRLMQRYILSLLYFQTRGQYWNDQLNFLSDQTECSWFHDILSACDDDGFLINLQLRKFVSLSLYNFESLMPSLTHLSFATHFYIAKRIRVTASNNLVGSLPEELTYLTRLERLDFNDNEGITGTLPGTIGKLSNLRFLGFNNAMLNGSLPEQLYHLTSLEEVYIIDNELTGTLSSHVGNLTSLSRFHIGTNFLSGTLPEEIFDIAGMIDFDIRANNFVGTFTESYQRWTDLESLVTFRNSFNGTLPTVVGTLTQLTNMQISDMSLHGKIPSELGTLTLLSRLALSYNLFTGTLPFEFLRLTNLKRLYLQSNDIDGDISFLCVADIGPMDPFRVDMWETVCSCCTCCDA